MKESFQRSFDMKIYVLKEYNTDRIVCISENILLIKKQLCNKEYFSTEYSDYPIMSVWDNGIQIEKFEGMDVLRKVAEVINNN